MTGVTELHGPTIDQRVQQLVDTAKAAGRADEHVRLRLLGEVHCLAPDIPEAEFLGVLARGGLCVSSVAGVQLIHRCPPFVA
jgi:hypothetical protein